MLAACYAAVFFAPWDAVWPAPPVPATLDMDLWAEWAGRQWSIHAANSVLVLALAAAVTRWLGLRLSDIGIRPVWARGRGHRRWGQWWAVFGLVLAAYVVATIIKVSVVPVVGGGTMADAHPVGFAAATFPIAFTTSWIEETVTVALLVLILSAARQPVWVLLVAVCVVKTLYHLYMGPGALAVIVPAVVCVWVYHRTGRLTPIIVAHIAHNAVPATLVLAGAAATQGLG